MENTGNAATGKLDIAADAANAAYFVLSKSSILNIEAEETTTFTVRPKTGLAPGGSYSATITVSGGNNISASFTVSYEEPAINPFGIGLFNGNDSEQAALSSLYYFLAEGEDGKLTVIVRNTGKGASGVLSVALSGDGIDSFTLGGLSGGTVASIEEDDEDSFTIIVKEELDNGIYNATVTVSNSENDLSESFDITYWAFKQEDFYGTFSNTTGSAPYRRIILDDKTFTFQWTDGKDSTFTSLGLDVESEIKTWEKVVWKVGNDSTPTGYATECPAWEITFMVTANRNYKGAGSAILPLYGGGAAPGNGTYTAWIICKDPANVSDGINIGFVNKNDKKATPWGNFNK